VAILCHFTVVSLRNRAAIGAFFLSPMVGFFNSSFQENPPGGGSFVCAFVGSVFTTRCPASAFSYGGRVEGQRRRMGMLGPCRLGHSPNFYESDALSGMHIPQLNTRNEASSGFALSTVQPRSGASATSPKPAKPDRLCWKFNV
jgi:hypothetical protein